MPYALFCNDARLSNAYPTEADVWKLARKSGLVVDAVSGDDRLAPRPVLGVFVGWRGLPAHRKPSHRGPAMRPGRKNGYHQPPEYWKAPQ